MNRLIGINTLADYGSVKVYLVACNRGIQITDVRDRPEKKDIQ